VADQWTFLAEHLGAHPVVKAAPIIPAQWQRKAS
jgi:hypothetical protein